MSHEVHVYGEPVEELSQSQLDAAGDDPSLSYEQELALAYRDPLAGHDPVLDAGADPNLLLDDPYEL